MMRAQHASPKSRWHGTRPIPCRVRRRRSAISVGTTGPQTIRPARPKVMPVRGTVAIGAILFDKDGTLIDYWLTWVPINREAALFAAGGDLGLARELLRVGGQDPATDHVVPGSVLAAGSVDDIAAAFAAQLGARTPQRLAQGIEAIFRRGGAEHGRLAR